MTHKLIGTLGTCTYEKPTFYHLSYDVNLKIMSLIVLTVCGDVFFSNEYGSLSRLPQKLSPKCNIIILEIVARNKKCFT